MAQIAMLAGLGVVKASTLKSVSALSPDELRDAWLRANRAPNKIDPKTGLDLPTLTLAIKRTGGSIPTFLDVGVDALATLTGGGSESRTPASPDAVKGGDTNTPPPTTQASAGISTPIIVGIGVLAVAAGVILYRRYSGRKLVGPAMAGLASFDPHQKRKGDKNWSFNWTEGGWNTVWAKNKSDAIARGNKIAAGRFHVDASSVKLDPKFNNNPIWD